MLVRRHLASAVGVDARDLRVAGGLMLGAAAVLPFVPGEAGIACPLRTATGVPCPLCGMTTSVTSTVHLDIASALAANPAGVLVVAVALFLLVRPRARIRLPVALIYSGLASMWLFEAHRFGIV